MLLGKIFLSLFLFSSFLLADLVDLYRLKGIKAVEQELSQVLKNKNYWEKFLENKDTKFGYYESKQYLIFCQKDTKKISLYKKENNHFLKILDNHIIVGEKEGDKQIEGDKKTPIGVYDLTSKLTKLDSFYGPFALVTSYPNSFDKIQNKKGHGIWIHGMPINQDREDFTRGCIALDNHNLKNLEKNMNYDESVLLISDDKIKNVSKDELSTILSFIYNWKDAWKSSDFDKYIAYYSQDFKKSKTQNYDTFRKYKKRIFKKKEDKLIVFSNINIMPYPNSLNKNLFKIIMDEEYKTNNYYFNGKKELYIELKDNHISILYES